MKYIHFISVLFFALYSHSLFAKECDLIELDADLLGEDFQWLDESYSNYYMYDCSVSSKHSLAIFSELLEEEGHYYRRAFRVFDKKEVINVGFMFYPEGQDGKGYVINTDENDDWFYSQVMSLKTFIVCSKDPECFGGVLRSVSFYTRWFNSDYKRLVRDFEKANNDYFFDVFSLKENERLEVIMSMQSSNWKLVVERSEGNNINGYKLNKFNSVLF